MWQSLYRGGTLKPFSKSRIGLSLRTIQLQSRPTTNRLGFNSSGPHPRSGSQRQFHDEWPRPPRLKHTLRRLVIWPFISLNVVVFISWQLAKAESSRHAKEIQATGHVANPTAEPFGQLKYMVDNYTLNMRNIQEGRWRTLFTNVISHEALDHLLFNMISFNAFAGFAIMAGIPFSTLLSLGVGSALASDAAALYNWNRRGELHRAAHGASGVISGMATALACTRPWTPFYFFFIPVEIPLWALVVGYIAYDSYRLNSEQSKVGHEAHLGGSAFGFLFYALVLHRRYGGVLNFLKMR